MMGKRKITCKNISCKHHMNEDICNTFITITINGVCGSFEKGFAYYFHIVWDALGSKNFIDAVEIQLNPDLKVGLYYVMECYGLGFSEVEWGTCRMFMLQDGKDGDALTYEQITSREMNMDKFEKHLKNFNNGIMPFQKQETEEKPDRDFGWVSPSGEFIESPWGEHEASAGNIVDIKGFKDEYRQWRKDGELHLMRDFLIQEKGYCLIHNPSCDGGYIVTHIKPLTKKQREFLYGYFIDKGDRFKAELYLEER